MRIHHIHRNNLTLLLRLRFIDYLINQRRQEERDGTTVFYPSSKQCAYGGKL